MYISRVKTLCLTNSEWKYKSNVYVYSTGDGDEEHMDSTVPGVFYVYRLDI